MSLSPLIIVIAFVAFLASLTLHEFCHALAGKLLGDDTAERAGRLTLNPLAHADLIGTILLPLMGLIFQLPLFGWAKPVPFNPYNLRNQKWGPVLVAFAGPMANLVLFVISALLLRSVGPSLADGNALGVFLMIMAQFNAALFLFNLIPLPPLDGSKFLLSFLSSPKYERTRFLLETRGAMYLMIFIVADSFLLGGLIFGTLLGGGIDFMFRLFGIA